MNLKEVTFLRKVGIAALMLFIPPIIYSQYRSYDSNNNSNTASYGRFNSGLNLFSWQLHSDASYSKPDDMKGTWQSNTLYLERGWSQILSTVQIGENYTSSLIFDSLRFSGIRLFRDMQMLPDSMQNFTPLVQSVAQSNALITVTQNGYIIYQKEVPPGPFTIADLQLSGSGADLDVSIKEADGSVRSFWCPTLPCPTCCNQVFQISILSPDAVRYMV